MKIQDLITVLIGSSDRTDGNAQVPYALGAATAGVVSRADLLKTEYNLNTRLYRSQVMDLFPDLLRYQFAVK